jgi:hypothetical protein
MRAFQIFAAMSAEEAAALFKRISDESPATFQQALHAASAAMKARPTYLRKQPFEKRAAAVRRVLSRVSSNAVAEEMLAIYFLDCRKELLVEWLEQVGVKHDDGTLEEDAPPQPDEEQLRTAVEKFRSANSDPDREILLKAFAAQDSIEWPALDAQLEA